MKVNYNLPLDADLFPEGTTRCSLTQFLAWLVPILLVLAWGGYGAFLVLRYGLGVTGLNDYFGFGLWIGFDLAVIALGAGAFFTGLLRYILNIEPLKNIINLAVVIGFLCYSGAMLVLALDVGQPIRSWFPFWHANVHSMLTEVVFCITCYLIVLTIEFVPLILEQKQLNRNRVVNALAHNFHLFMPLFAGVGAFLSTFHQGSLGGMFGVMFGRPFAFREGFFIWPWTFFLFILSAVGSGPVFTVLICTLMEKITGKKLVAWDVKSIMGKIAGTMLCVYLLFKFLDTGWWIYDTIGKAGMTFDQMFNGWMYGKWLLFTELFVCGLLPAVILVKSSLRNRPGLFYAAAILDCAGVAMNRYMITVQTMAQPVMPFDTWAFYLPNWVEWACSFLVLAYGALVLSLAYRYLPMFPQETRLNPPGR